MSGPDMGAAGRNDTVSEDGAASAKPRRPRQKAARKANVIQTAEALSAGGAEAMAELAGLKHTMDQLEQGLREMLVIQGTHTEMMRQLVDAVTVPDEPEHQVAEWLEEIVGLLQAQGSRLAAVSSTLRELPAEVGLAVAKEVASALDKVQ